jgi:uracil phosphoribosyltransferase
MHLVSCARGKRMELLHKDGYRMYRVADPRFPANTYIICCGEASRILYRPHIAGKELQDEMEKMSSVFVDAAWRTALKGKEALSVAELVLLSGGLYYQLNTAFKKKFGLALPQCFIGIKRQHIEGMEGGFIAVATYQNFDSLTDKANIIIGDTIATGATIQKSIYHLLDAMHERKYALKNLVICSLACSVTGAEIIREAAEKVVAEFPRAKVHLLVAEGLFHLMPNGTDMRFLRPETVMPDETRERILRNYGEYLGREMKCAVFDWGTRCKNPMRHYGEFLEFSHRFLSRARDWMGIVVVKHMQKETREALRKLKKRL